MRAIPILLFCAGVLSACSSERACTAIGAEPGVGFDLAEVLTSRPMDVEVCVETTCLRRRRATVDRWSTVFVEDRTLTSVRDVEVSVVLRRPGRLAPVLDLAATVRSQAHQPNGPECPPLVFVAAVDVDAEGIRQVLPVSSG